MSQTKSEKINDKPLALVMPSYGLVNYGRLRSILSSMAKQMGWRLHFDGADMVQKTPDGLLVKIKPGGDDNVTSPWQCYNISGSLWCGGGSYNSTPIPATNLGTGTGWAYLRATWNVSDVEDGYLLSASLTSVGFFIGSSVPGDLPLSGQFSIPIVQFAEGKVVGVHRNSSISARVCDDGSGSGRGVHQG